MNNFWQYNVEELEFVIEEDQNVGFYLIVYPRGSNQSLKDHLCDSFDEAVNEAYLAYGIQREKWSKVSSITKPG